jgi:hypothetical protein
MFGSQVLDVVVGMVFVYLLLSIICTAANEMIASLFSLRGRTLAKGITNLFADKQIKGLVELFYDHPLIKSLYRGKRKPSFIPPHTFALALFDGIAPAKGDGTALMSELKAAVIGLPGDSELRRVLMIFLEQAGDDFTKFSASIETWFNDAMARVSGWYKRKTQVITLILALLITGITNADTLQIVKKLSTDPTLRAAIVVQAQEFARQQGIAARQPEKTPEPSAPSSAGQSGGPTPVQPQPATTGDPQETMKETLEKLQQTGIPVGWQIMPKKEEWGNKFIGLLLTVFAISLGAPFWFDMLNKIVKIRPTGASPEATAKEEKKEKPA